MFPAVLLALACGGGSAPPAGPPLPFSQTGAPAPLQLDALPATLVLASSTLAPGEVIPDAFDLPPAPDFASDDGSGRYAWSWDLPFVVDPGQERFAPPGMQVFVNGQEVGYDISPYAPGRTGWRVKDGRLHVVLGEDLGPQGARVLHPALVAEVRRLDPSTSGLPPAEFTHFTWTRDRVTRPGLLLPAPSSATWTVALPQGARFRAEPDLVDVSLRNTASDGAEVALVVTADGVEEEAGRARVVAGGIVSWGGLGVVKAEWDVDLSEWAGRTVTLRLETRVTGDAAHDWVFVGAPVVWGTPKAPVRRVVVVGIDTLRPDHLGANGYARPTSPEMDAFAGTAQVFDHAWSPAPRTRPSFRSSTTGRRPLDAVTAPTFGEVFRAHGFATAGIVANVHLNPRFGFDDGFDEWHLDPEARADQQVDLGLEWLREHQDRDSFLFLHLMDPHLFYDAPGAWRTKFLSAPEPPFPPLFNRWEVYDWAHEGRMDDAAKTWMTDLYDGEIAWTSHEVGRLLAGLDALGGNDLVVIHSDHGEELFDHGGFEHNHSLYDEVLRAVVWVRPPDRPAGARISEPVTLADIAPTLYAYAGFESPPPSDGRSLRPLIEHRDPGGWDRAIPVGHLMYDAEQWGVVWRDHKYVIATASGEERLYDLVADPKEMTDVKDGVDLDPYRDALAHSHGMAVGPGWRIQVDLDFDEPLVWELPVPAISAGVIDPEAGVTNRSNQEWGETPVLRADDVATVQLSDDGRTLVALPGYIGNGVLYVRFAEPVPPGGTVRRGDEPLVLGDGVGGTAWAMSSSTRVVVHTGTIVEPPPDEAARMAALGVGAADPHDLDLLRVLGYVGGGD